MEWKEAFEAAVEKTVGAYEKMEKAIFSDDKEDFKRCHADYCRYIDLFSKVTGIPESQFIEIVNDAARKRRIRVNQNKSRVCQRISEYIPRTIKAPEMDFPGLIVYLSTYGIKNANLGGWRVQTGISAPPVLPGNWSGILFPLIPPSLAPIVSHIL